MIPLEFVTTAMPRAEIFEKTCKSFVNNLKGIDFLMSTLYINIDPLDEDDLIDRKKMIDIAKKYFGNVISRCPSIPNYCSAYIWCWTRPIGTWFFNLEDDWMLIKKYDIEELLKFATDKIDSISLRAHGDCSEFKDSYPAAYKRQNRNWKDVTFYDKIPTSPSIYRTSAFKEIAEIMNSNINPECQMHEIMKKQYENGEKPKPVDRLVLVSEQKVVVLHTGDGWAESIGYIAPRWLSKDDPRFAHKRNFVRYVKI